MNKQQIKYRALWALEFGKKHNYTGIIEDANLILAMLKTKVPWEIMRHQIVGSKGYGTIVRVWNRNPIL